MRTALTTLATLVIAAAAVGQPAANLRARIPHQGRLDRLNLRLAWNIALPVEGTRDGIATVQLLPVPDPARKGAETVLLVVQTRSGTVAVYNAESGRKLWSKQPPPAYPAKIHEVTYDPRGALIVVRDLNLYRYDIVATQAAAGATDETDNRLAVLPTIPTTAPVVVVPDPALPNQALIIVCFNGNSLAVYARADAGPRVKADTAPLNWKVRYDESSLTDFKPGDNKVPSLTVARSVFGPDYGLKDRPPVPEPPFPSLTMVRDLSRPSESAVRIASTPSLTVVHRLTQLAEANQRDIRGSALDATILRGDVLDFRLSQPPHVILGTTDDPYGRGPSAVNKIVLVGTDREVQIDMVSERRGLLPQRRIGRELFRSAISAPAAFRGDVMYVPTADSTVYAVQSEHGLVSWTTTLQSVPNRPPAAVGPDLFVTTNVGKMFRLGADDGGPASGGSFEPGGSFPHSSLRQFLAASDRHVYAVDRSGKLVVFDRRRGTEQGQIDVTGFSTTYLNDTTDQVILGSDDGKLICLRDATAPALKRYRGAARLEAPAPAAPPAAAPPAPSAPADDAKPMPEKKPAGAGPMGDDKPMPK